MESRKMTGTKGSNGATCDGSPKLINDIEAGKHDELLSEMTNDEPMKTMDALEADLVDDVTIGIPSLYGDGFIKETIHVEYEWRPPRCDLYKLFGHVHDHYPKK
ncbi:hypothetical protein Tco_0848179, partial [Tanacetum coccineum]